jgi:nitrogen-specific signal transduction histidine kinase
VVSGIRGADGRIVHLLDQAEDISARKEAEDRLRQAERLEALGRLAGGVAREFNNLLAVIAGFARHALAKTDSKPLGRDLTEIWDATDRAAEITRQLLAFSREEESQPSVVDVNDVARGNRCCLRSLIREDVELVLSLTDDVRLVRVDQRQLERLILNLERAGTGRDLHRLYPVRHRRSGRRRTREWRRRAARAGPRRCGNGPRRRGRAGASLAHRADPVGGWLRRRLSR